MMQRRGSYADFGTESLSAVVQGLGSFATGPPSGETEYSDLGCTVLGVVLNPACGRTL
jgi:hypothetical protein